MIAGIDFSTKAVDVVLLDENSDAATWHRYPLIGNDAFDRTRCVRPSMPGAGGTIWDDVLAVGIEDPRGYGAGSLYRIQGAILSCLPHGTLVQPWIPSQWRKQVGLPGNAPKCDVSMWANNARLWATPDAFVVDWPQDACDAYCIALATRNVLETRAA